MRGGCLSCYQPRQPGGPQPEKYYPQSVAHICAKTLPFTFTELALMFASRTINEYHRTRFERRKPGTLADCFTDSTEGTRAGCSWQLNRIRILCGGLQPDVTILMDSTWRPAWSVRGRAATASRAVNSPEVSNEKSFEQEKPGLFKGKKFPCLLKIVGHGDKESLAFGGLRAALRITE